MTDVDPIVLDLIENALKNARFEMDEVVRRAAMSPTIREQHDEFPMIANERGEMIVGQFGSYIPEVIRAFDGQFAEGDAILQNDPYICKGSISHTNDWLVMLPIFHRGELVGFASLFGHMMDVGGPVPGSQISDARSIWEEGLRIPPIKIMEAGRVNDAALAIILNNTRTPDMNRSDLYAIVAACRRAGERVVEICERFGVETYRAACEALLERTRKAMARLVMEYLPDEPVSFEDWVDDDGRGNGPFKMKLTIWREGDVAHFDWTGTDPQAEGPINFHIHEGLCKMFFGVYLIMAFDPAILFNEGFYSQFVVTLPEGSLLNPRFPAALSNRLNTHTRFFDCQSGALGQKNPALSMAAGYGTSPYFVYSGYDEDGDYFVLVELLFGGVPGRPLGDGIDGASWWPLFTSTPIEYVESYYPLIIESYGPVQDSGGAGLHRGGTGIEKTYRFLAEGEVTINDDRAVTHPWGIGGGRHGGVSAKLLIRADGERIPLPSKLDFVKVHPGDRLVFRTAGAGGFGDPFERAAELVARDVRRGLVSRGEALSGYGVVCDDDGVVDQAATAETRQRFHAQRGLPETFDFGPIPESFEYPEGFDLERVRR